MLGLLRRTCLSIARRVLVAVLFLALDAEPADDLYAPPVLRPALSRPEILDVLERAEQNDTAAQALLSQRTPAVAWGGAP